MYMQADKVSFVALMPGDTAVSPTAPDTMGRIDLSFVCNPVYWKPEAQTSMAMYAEEPCGSIAAYEQGQDHLNYYLPHCSGGITDVPGYARIVYENAFPDIDVHFYSNSWAPKIYFVVKPGGNPYNILLHFTGQDSISQITTNSALNMYLNSWRLSFPQAIAYQIDGSNNVTLMPWLPDWTHNGGGYVGISGLGTYNTADQLVIAVGGAGEKPTAIGNLDWSVYYGGTGWEYSPRIHAKGQNVYHAMIVSGSQFPATNGTEVVNYNSGFYDCYISGFENTVRKWATYYGGSLSDYPTAIKTFENENIINDIGEVWVTGETYSLDLPQGNITTPHFYQAANAGLTQEPSGDGLIASFNKTNGQLRYSTYFGAGNGSVDAINDMDIDEETGMLYFVGLTNHMGNFTDACGPQTTGNFPLCSGNGSSNYFKSTKVGEGTFNNYEGFIGRFRLEDLSLNWCTLFGGERDDEIRSVKVKNGELFVGGNTYSHNTEEYPSPTTTHSPEQFPLSDPGNGAFFQQNPGAEDDYNMFFSKFNSDLSLVWSTLLGSSSGGISSIDINSQNDLYLLGYGIHYLKTAPVSPLPNNNGYVPMYHTGSAYFEAPANNNQILVLMKFNHENNALLWSTPIHSIPQPLHVYPSPVHRTTGMVVDQNDKVFVGSWINNTSAPVFYVAGHYWQPQNSYIINPAVTAPTDNYLLGFSSENSLYWSTFFGGAVNSSDPAEYGNSSDRVHDIATSGDYLYITGSTNCLNSPYKECLTASIPNSYCDQSYNGATDCYISRFNISYNPPLSTTGVQQQHIQLHAYPNPSNGLFSVSFASNINDNCNLKIIDINGKLVSQTEFKAKSGINTFSLDFSTMASGVYIVQMNGDKVNGSVKIVKQ